MRNAILNSFISLTSFHDSWVSNLSSPADRMVLTPALALMALITLNILTLMSAEPGLWRASMPLAVTLPDMPRPLRS